VYVFVQSVASSEGRGHIVRVRPHGTVVRALGFGDGPGVPCATVFATQLTELEGAIDRCSPITSFLAIDGAGRPLFAEVGSIRRIESSLSIQAPAASTLVPSADGSEVWVFDGSGRPLRTVDGLTGATLSGPSTAAPAEREPRVVSDRRRQCGGHSPDGCGHAPQLSHRRDRVPWR
jgi:hypothetical protein